MSYTPLAVGIPPGKSPLATARAQTQRGLAPAHLPSVRELVATARGVGGVSKKLVAKHEYKSVPFYSKL